jgi:hypothetical protein
LDAPYQIFLRLTSEVGKVVGEDRISPEGFGVEEKLLRIPPSRYRLALWTETLGKDRPLYDKVVELRRDFPPRFHFGLLTLDVPEAGQKLYRKTLQFTLRFEPSKDPVLEGILEDLHVKTTFGDLLWGKVILPFGSYSLVLEDLDTQDEARLLAQDGLPMKKTDPIPFTLSEATPSVMIDLASMLSAQGEARTASRWRR